jgi:hypothetical protein
MKRLIITVFAVTVGYAVLVAADEFRPPVSGKVYFKNLHDGETVPSRFKVDFGIDGAATRPAGQDIFDRKSGHHHLIIDGGPIALGQPVPADNKHLHYGKGQQDAEVSLAPGTHTLTMQFADGAHRSYGPTWAETITVTVQ